MDSPILRLNWLFLLRTLHRVSVRNGICFRTKCVLRLLFYILPTTSAIILSAKNGHTETVALLLE